MSRDDSRPLAMRSVQREYPTTGLPDDERSCSVVPQRQVELVVRVEVTRRELTEVIGSCPASSNVADALNDLR